MPIHFPPGLNCFRPEPEAAPPARPAGPAGPPGPGSGNARPLPAPPRASTLERFKLMRRGPLSRPQPAVRTAARPETLLDLVRISNSKGDESVTHEELRKILLSVQTEYDLPNGSAADLCVKRYLATLDGKPGDLKLDALTVQNATREIGEEIHKHQHDVTPHDLKPRPPKMSSAPREAARMPSECMMHWLAAADKTAKAETDPARKARLEALVADAKTQWMQHKLTFKDARSYFAKMETDCGAAGIGELAALARELKAQIPGEAHDDMTGATDEIKYKTRLHDNPYGRAYESYFIGALVENPPEGVKNAMFKLGNHIADMTLMPKDLTAADQARLGPIYERHLNHLQFALIVDDRGWQDQSPRLKAFLEAKTTAEKAQTLDELLRAPKVTGIDCITIPQVAMKAIVTSPWLAPAWRQAADKNYSNTIYYQHTRITKDEHVGKEIGRNCNENVRRMQQGGKSAAEIDDVTQKANDLIEIANQTGRQSLVKDAAAGITLHHQPPALSEPWMRAASRPVNRYTPNFAHPPEKHDSKGRIVRDTSALPPQRQVPTRLPESVQQALSHGIPFASGVSGTTNVILHATDHLNKGGAAISQKDALLATMMFVNFDGGHSPHECMWIANQLEGTGPGKLDLGLNLGDPAKPATEFVADYTRLAALFEDPASGSNPVNSALDQAFDKTIRYFENNSHYARTNPPLEVK